MLVLVSLLAMVLGYGYGDRCYRLSIQALEIMQNELHIFEGKKHITGTIDTRVFSKERSDIYRLNIDTVDTISIRDGPIPEGKYSIFIEVPSNLDMHPGEKIGFVGKVSKNIHFPLSGYERYAFSHG